MTFEAATDTAQSAAHAAALAIAYSVPHEGRGDITAAVDALTKAEQALRYALAGVVSARAMLAERA